MAKQPPTPGRQPSFGQSGAAAPGFGERFLSNLEAISGKPRRQLIDDGIRVMDSWQAALRRRAQATHVDPRPQSIGQANFDPQRSADAAPQLVGQSGGIGFGAFDSGADGDSVSRRLNAIFDAMVRQFEGPSGIGPETWRQMQEQGLFRQEGRDDGLVLESLQAFNEGLIGGSARVLDTVVRTAAALESAGIETVVQAALETGMAEGEARRLRRDLFVLSMIAQVAAGGVNIRGIRQPGAVARSGKAEGRTISAGTAAGPLRITERKLESLDGIEPKSLPGNATISWTGEIIEYTGVSPVVRTYVHAEVPGPDGGGFVLDTSLRVPPGAKVAGPVLETGIPLGFGSAEEFSKFSSMLERKTKDALRTKIPESVDSIRIGIRGSAISGRKFVPGEGHKGRAFGPESDFDVYIVSPEIIRSFKEFGGNLPKRKIRADGTVEQVKEVMIFEDDKVAKALDLKQLIEKIRELTEREKIDSIRVFATSSAASERTPRSGRTAIPAPATLLIN